MRSAVAPTSTRRLAGAAGLGYVLGASIENMEILEAPTLDSRVPAIRAFYADQAFGVVTTAAGAVALLLYCVFAVQLFAMLGSAEAGASRGAPSGWWAAWAAPSRRHRAGGDGDPDGERPLGAVR